MSAKGRGRGRGRVRGRGAVEPPQSHRTPSPEDAASSSLLASAPLPPRYAITAAFAASHAPTKAELHAAYVAGAEVVSDAAESANAPLVPLPPRWLLCDNAAHRPPPHAESSAAALWRTAGLSYPCLCTLSHFPRAYTPPFPTPVGLSALEPQADDLTPRFGDALLPWSTGTVDELDLDAALDTLQEFECLWPRAPPWPSAKGKGREAALPPAATLASALRADTQPARLPPRALDPLAPPSSAVLPDTEDHPAPPLPQRARQAWWRAEIERDVGYGRLLPLFKQQVWPAPAHPPAFRRRTTDSDAFRTPRNLAALSHPLHPALGHFTAAARCRVYWLVPVHGPVVIPTLEDIVADEHAKPWTSAGVLDDLGGKGEKKRPATVRWTAILLRAFVAAFEALQRDPARPYGALHLALSGPKPDPYLALAPPPPLEAHRHVPDDSAVPHRVPVRPEAGDHIRLYCDAARAMSLRTWLHWWEVAVDSSAWDSAVPPAAVRPFEFARLTLVGPRGEALMVA